MPGGRLWYGTALVLTAATGFGLNPLFARLLYAEGLSPEVVTLYRFGLPALLLLPVLRLARRERPEALRMLGLGLLNGVGTLAYFQAIEVLPIATAVLVYYTYPVFSVLAGRFLFRRQPSREALIAAALVAVAALLVASPEGLPAAQRLALLLSFLAPLAYGILIQYLAAPIAPLPPLRRLGWGLGGHLLVLVPLALAATPAGAPTVPATGTGWLAVAGLALLAAALPQLLFTVGAPIAGAERATMAGAGELVVSVLIGAYAFAEPLGREQLVAMLLVLIALALPREGVPATRASAP